MKKNAENTDHPDHKREIRSYVVRSARMTDAQQTAYDAHVEKWGIKDKPETIKAESAFSNDNPIHLEIGFGMGDSLASMAEAKPNTNYLGIEVHPPGIGRLLALVEKKALSNVRVVQGDAVRLLKARFRDHSLERINIFFPDPWHKKRHHKRRLIQPDFVGLLHQKLLTGGLLHVATDWTPYADHVMDVMEQCEGWRAGGNGNPVVQASDLGRPETKFERRGLKLGHEIVDLAYTTTS